MFVKFGKFLDTFLQRLNSNVFSTIRKFINKILSSEFTNREIAGFSLVLFLAIVFLFIARVSRVGSFETAVTLNIGTELAGNIIVTGVTIILIRSLQNREDKKLEDIQKQLEETSKELQKLQSKMNLLVQNTSSPTDILYDKNND